VEANAGPLVRSFRLGRAPCVSVGNISGRVTVSGTARETVVLHAAKLGGTPGEQAAHRIEIERRGDRLEIRTRCPQLFRGCGRVKVDYRLEVPAGTDLHCHTVSASVRVRGVRGALRLQTVSGAVDAEGSGPARLRARSVSGAVRVRGAAGTLKLSSVSGRIRVELRSPPQRLDLDSVSGRVGLLLARGVGARLRLSTLSGSIESALPMETLERRGRRKLRVVVGDGAVPVRVRTVSGSVKLAALD
jgi:hypothetical protein